MYDLAVTFLGHVVNVPVFFIISQHSSHYGQGTKIQILDMGFCLG